MYHDAKTASFDAGRARSAKGVLFLDLAGPLCLSDAHGADLTPKSRKAQGLLALIATSPCLRRSRIWLQDKLWSERDPEQSAACLRQCLLRIRSALGDQADCLKMEKGWIGFDSARVVVRTDPLRPDLGGEVEFLEGLDISDPEFEEWLRDQRSFYWERWNRDAAEPRAAQADANRSAAGPYLVAKASAGRVRPALAAPARPSPRRDAAADPLNDLVVRLVARSLLAGAAGLAAADDPAYLTICALADGAVDPTDLTYEQRQLAARLALKAMCELFQVRDLVGLNPGAKSATLRAPSPRKLAAPALGQRRYA